MTEALHQSLMVRQCLKPECWRHNILYIAIQYRAAGSMLNQYIGVIFSIVLWSHDSPPPPFMDLGMTLRNVGKSANLQILEFGHGCGGLLKNYQMAA